MRTLRLAAFAATLAVPAVASDLTIAEPFARATPENARASAAYMTITNAGAEDDRLVAARTDAARRVELHTHILEDGVARMREVEGGIPAPAGETVALEPGGLHVMLMGLTRRLVEGERLDLTLVFERAGEVSVSAPIRPIVAGGRHGGAMGN